MRAVFEWQLRHFCWKMGATSVAYSGAELPSASAKAQSPSPPAHHKQAKTGIDRWRTFFILVSTNELTQHLFVVFHDYGDDSRGTRGSGFAEQTPNANLALRIPSPESRTPIAGDQRFSASA